MRFVFRLFCLPFVLILFALVASPARLFPPAIRSRWLADTLSACNVVLCRLMGFRIFVSGRVPQRPVLLVSNHLGYVDILVLASIVPAVFISKSEVKDWPGIGWLCRLYDTIFFERRNFRSIPSVNRIIAEVLDLRRQSVIFFPEGTSTDGSDILPFNPALLEDAARNNRAVHACRISYRTADSDPPAESSVCWWGGMTFVDHFFGLLKLRTVDAQVVFADQPIASRDRKDLAKRLRGAVLQQPSLIGKV